LHQGYIRRWFDEGKLLLVGPCTDFVYGLLLIILCSPAARLENRRSTPGAAPDLSLSLRSAREHTERGDYAKAIADDSEILQLYPNNRFALENRARERLYAKDYRGAL
jgi:hypothetical protein